MFDLVTFLHFSLLPTLWIYGGAGKGQNCKPGTQADAVPGTLDDSFGEEALERGLWASPCGDVDQEASGREGGLFQEPWQSMVWKGFPKAGSRFPQDLLLAQLHTYSPCSGSFAVQLLSTVELNCSRMWRSKPFSQNKAHIWL